MTDCLLADGRCDGRIQEHHLIPRRTIKDRYQTMKYRGETPPYSLTKALQDGRNLVGLCHLHHGRVTACRMYVRPHHLPDGLWEFAEELGLDWFIDRHWPAYGKEVVQ